MSGLNRRQVLGAGAGALAVAALGSAPAHAANNAQDLIKGDLVFVGRPEDVGTGQAGQSGKP